LNINTGEEKQLRRRIFFSLFHNGNNIYVCRVISGNYCIGEKQKMALDFEEEISDFSILEKK